MEKMKGRDYADLQEEIDKLIGKLGMAKTIKVIKQISGTREGKKKVAQKDILIPAFVTSEAFKIFEVVHTKTGKNTSTPYKEARMASYYLMDQYTELSYNEIGKSFQQKKFGVYYHLMKCKDALSLPKMNKTFVSRLTVLEELLIEFLTNIN